MLSAGLHTHIYYTLGSCFLSGPSFVQRVHTTSCKSCYRCCMCMDDLLHGSSCASAAADWCWTLSHMNYSDIFMCECFYWNPFSFCSCISYHTMSNEADFVFLPSSLTQTVVFILSVLDEYKISSLLPTHWFEDPERSQILFVSLTVRNTQCYNKR
jgi:hypothetical protein